VGKSSGQGRGRGPEARRDAQSVWDQVRSSMAEWYGVAAEKTEEMARIGVRKYDQLTISRTLERAYAELGAHVCGALQIGQTDFGQDPKVAVAVARIRDLEEQLARKEREIAEIRGTYHPGAPPEPAPRALTPGAAAGALDEPEGIAIVPVPPPEEPAASSAPEAEIDPCLVPDEEEAFPSGRRPVLDAWEEELSRWDEPGADEES